MECSQNQVESEESSKEDLTSKKDPGQGAKRGEKKSKTQFPHHQKNGEGLYKKSKLPTVSV